MSKQAIYKFTLDIGLVGCHRRDEITANDMGYTNAEWNELTEDDRKFELDTHLEEWTNSYVNNQWEKL